MRMPWRSGAAGYPPGQHAKWRASRARYDETPHSSIVTVQHSAAPDEESPEAYPEHHHGAQAVRRVRCAVLSPLPGVRVARWPMPCFNAGGKADSECPCSPSSGSAAARQVAGHHSRAGVPGGGGSARCFWLDASCEPAWRRPPFTPAAAAAAVASADLLLLQLARQGAAVHAQAARRLRDIEPRRLQHLVNPRPLPRFERAGAVDHVHTSVVFLQAEGGFDVFSIRWLGQVVAGVEQLYSERVCRSLAKFPANSSRVCLQNAVHAGCPGRLRHDSLSGLWSTASNPNWSYSRATSSTASG